MYRKIIKYFYSWYTLPLVILHELCHVLIALLLNYKILKVKFYIDKNIPIFNGAVYLKYKPYDKKYNLVAYAPLLLLLLCFNIYGLLYLISTIFYYKKTWIILFLPSKNDKENINKLKYFEYIVENVGEDEFNLHLKNNMLRQLIIKNHLLNEIEFKQFKN